MKYAALALTAAVCVTHLVSCIGKWARVRSVTKILLMPLIAACYLCWVSMGGFNWLVLAAMAFGWLGDLLLLSRTKQNLFVVGACSFAVGHFFYIVAVLMERITAFYRPILLIALAFLLVPAALTFFLRRELKRARLRAPMAAYFMVLSALGLFCAAALYTNPALSNALLLAGALMFLASDAILVTIVFKISRVKGCGNFWVMLTYILAQGLLTAGFCL